MIGFSLDAKNNSAGFTLVELMASVVISLVILAGVVQSVLASKAVYMLQEEMARIQENSRFALDVLTTDIRMAGYTGCGGSALVTNVVMDTDDWHNGYPGIYGLDGGVDTIPSSFTNPLADQDIVVVRSGDTDIRMKVSDHAHGTATIDAVGGHGVESGAIMIIANASCQNIGIFRGAGASVDEVSHAIGLGNCYQNLTFGGDCSSAPMGSGSPYGPGSTVIPMNIRAFYIATNAQGVPSLFMKPVAADGSSDREELVEGVEGMQLSYGVDTDANGEVDRFQIASDITDWDRVKAVRVQLLMRSISALSGDEISIDFNGHNYADGHMRQVVSSTVMLRNL
jgi:type IV pilus assembly protein PilW